MRKGTPVPTQLRARLQRALDHGLTQTQLVALAEFGPTTGQNVGRALQGSPLNVRTTRALTRAVEAFERSKGYGPEAQSVVAPVAKAVAPVAKAVAPVVEAVAPVTPVEDEDDIMDIFADYNWTPRPDEPKRPIPAELGEELVLAAISQAESVCLKWEHPRWRHVLALLVSARSEI